MRTLYGFQVGTAVTYLNAKIFQCPLWSRPLKIIMVATALDANTDILCISLLLSPVIPRFWQ